MRGRPRYPRTSHRRSSGHLAVAAAWRAGHAAQRLLCDRRGARPAGTRPGGANRHRDRSQAALRRTAELGNGWLAAWCNAETFATNLATIDVLAAAAGRSDVDWQHGYQNWIGVDRDRHAALRRLAPAMEAFYGVPFPAFEPYAPVGSPSEIADHLAPFAAARCTTFSLYPVAGSVEAGIAAAAEIKQRLAAGSRG